MEFDKVRIQTFYMDGLATKISYLLRRRTRILRPQPTTAKALTL